MYTGEEDGVIFESLSRRYMNGRRRFVFRSSRKNYGARVDGFGGRREGGEVNSSIHVIIYRFPFR